MTTVRVSELVVTAAVLVLMNVGGLVAVLQVSVPNAILRKVIRELVVGRADDQTPPNAKGLFLPSPGTMNVCW